MVKHLCWNRHLSNLLTVEIQIHINSNTFQIFMFHYLINTERDKFPHSTLWSSPTICQRFSTKYYSILREILSHLLKEIVQTVHNLFKKTKFTIRVTQKVFYKKNLAEVTGMLIWMQRSTADLIKYILWEGIKEWM